MIKSQDFHKAIEKARKSDILDFDELNAILQMMVDNQSHFVYALQLLEGVEANNDDVVNEVIANANANYYRKPNLLTLLEEIAEMILSGRGKHDDPLELELIQMAGICINIVRRIRNGDKVELKTEDFK